jgi:hypothetical protein
MNIRDYLELIAEVKPSRIENDDGQEYVTKEGGLYLTRVGMEDHIDFIRERGITQHLQGSDDTSTVACVGYAPETEKWYGWSHRAIYGFKIGSTCHKGDCHHVPNKGEWTAKTLDDAKQMAIDFAEGVG